MRDRARAAARLDVFSLFVAAVIALIVLSPPALADDDLFTPSAPSIVVGDTVHQPTTIVVDPQTPTGTIGPGPIDASKPIGVDPRTLPPKPQIIGCCYADANGDAIPNWMPNANPPVVQKERRKIDSLRIAFLDNHGRYWLITHRQPLKLAPNGSISVGNAILFEQVGGWPSPGQAPPPLPGNLPPSVDGPFYAPSQP